MESRTAEPGRSTASSSTSFASRGRPRREVLGKGLLREGLLRKIGMPISAGEREAGRPIFVAGRLSPCCAGENRAHIEEWWHVLAVSQEHLPSQTCRIMPRRVICDNPRGMIREGKSLGRKVGRGQREGLRVLGALIIVFREVVEAGLIVGIVLAVTQSIPRRMPYIIGGVVAGICGAGLVAAFAGAMASMIAGSGQEVFNASVLSLAVAMLTWHNVWMARHGREMAASLHEMGRELRNGSKTLLALAIVVAVAVLREGSEIVLFLYGIVISAGASGVGILTGGLIGLLLGAGVAFLTFKGLIAIPMRHLFRVTTLLISFMAAGMAVQAIAFLEQADLATQLDRVDVEHLRDRVGQQPVRPHPAHAARLYGPADAIAACRLYRHARHHLRPDEALFAAAEAGRSARNRLKRGRQICPGWRAYQARQFGARGLFKSPRGGTRLAIPLLPIDIRLRERCKIEAQQFFADSARWVILPVMGRDAPQSQDVLAHGQSGLADAYRTFLAWQFAALASVRKQRSAHPRPRSGGVLWPLLSGTI